MFLYLYIAARLAAFLLMVAYLAGGVRRVRSGSRGSSVLFFLAALVFLPLSGLLAIL